jgi:hypothetical protein
VSLYSSSAAKSRVATGQMALHFVSASLSLVPLSLLYPECQLDTSFTTVYRCGRCHSSHTDGSSGSDDLCSGTQAWLLLGLSLNCLGQARYGLDTALATRRLLLFAWHDVVMILKTIRLDTTPLGACLVGSVCRSTFSSQTFCFLNNMEVKRNMVKAGENVCRELGWNAFACSQQHGQQHGSTSYSTKYDAQYICKAQGRATWVVNVHANYRYSGYVKSTYIHTATTAGRTGDVWSRSS